MLVFKKSSGVVKSAVIYTKLIAQTKTGNKSAFGGCAYLPEILYILMVFSPYLSSVATAINESNLRCARYCPGIFIYCDLKTWTKKRALPYCVR